MSISKPFFALPLLMAVLVLSLAVSGSARRLEADRPTGGEAAAVCRRRPSCLTVPQRPVPAATFIRPRFLLHDQRPKQPSMPSWSLKISSGCYTPNMAILYFSLS